MNAERILLQYADRGLRVLSTTYNVRRPDDRVTPQMEGLGTQYSILGTRYEVRSAE